MTSEVVPKPTTDQNPTPPAETGSTSHQTPLVMRSKIWGYWLVAFMFGYGLMLVYGYLWDLALALVLGAAALVVAVAVATDPLKALYEALAQHRKMKHLDGRRNEKNADQKEDPDHENPGIRPSDLKALLKTRHLAPLFFVALVVPTVLLALLRLISFWRFERALDVGAVTGSIIIVLGILVGVLFYRQNTKEPAADDETNRRRIIEGVLSGFLVFFGIVLLFWPEAADSTQTWNNLLTAIQPHQNTIGALVVGAGLIGLVFSFENINIYALKVKRPVVLGVLFRLIGYSLAIAFAWDRQDLAGIAGMGLIVLVTTLLVANFVSKDADLNPKHLRNAITLGMFFSFFGLLAFGSPIEPTENSILNGILEHFWAVLISVVAFHFGSVSADHIADTRKKTREALEQKAGKTGTGTATG